MGFWKDWEIKKMLVTSIFSIFFFPTLFSNLLETDIGMKAAFNFSFEIFLQFLTKLKSLRILSYLLINK